MSFVTLCVYVQQGYAFGRVGLCIYIFVSRFVDVSKAHARGGSAGVYTRTGAKILAKIIIDQKITWSNRHTVQK